MTEFNLHTPDTAPGTAKKRLQATEDKLGFVPSMYGMMANAPTLLEGYQTLSDIFGRSSLSPQEQQVVLLAVSVANQCEFCVAAHTTLAQGAGLDENIIQALREGGSIGDPRLAALAKVTQAIVGNQGWAGKEVDEFLAAGFEQQQVMEVILAAGLKTLSNYTNHLTNPPLNEAFAKNAWKAS
jgi:AhpD family alkylhydroperoxidase